MRVNPERACGPLSSERNVAVVPAAAAELREVIGTDRGRDLLRPALHAAARARSAALATAAGRSTHEAHVLAHDLGRVALLAFLVLPLPGAQRALDEDLAALREVLLREVGLLAEQHDAVPLGFVLPPAVAVGTPLVRGHVERGDRGAALGVAHLGIAAETTEQDDAIETH